MAESVRSAGEAPASCNNAVKIVETLAPVHGLWLVNDSDQATRLAAGELCGFNVGSYKEMALQAAKNTEDGLPWLVAADYTLLVIVDQGSKRLSCLAEVAADLARSSGCTELSVTDHDVVQRVEAHFSNHAS